MLLRWFSGCKNPAPIVIILILSLLLTIVLINVMRSWFCGSSGNRDWVDLKGFRIRFPAEPHYFTFRMHGMNSPPSSCRLLQSNRCCWRWIPWLVLDQQLLPCILCKSIFFFFKSTYRLVAPRFCPSLSVSIGALNISSRVWVVSDPVRVSLEPDWALLVPPNITLHQALDYQVGFHAACLWL